MQYTLEFVSHVYSENYFTWNIPRNPQRLNIVRVAGEYLKFDFKILFKVIIEIYIKRRRNEV